MKRSALKRNTALKSGGSLSRSQPIKRNSSGGLRAIQAPSADPVRSKPTPRRPRTAQPARGRRVWYAFKRSGKCEACGRYGPREAHHVVLFQRFERTHPHLEWDLRNRWLLGISCCHSGHHHPGVNDTRLERTKIPPGAVEFGREVLGDGAAEIYFQRRYRA